MSNAGSIFVSVLPDTSRFAPQAIAQLRGQAGFIEGALRRAGFGAAAYQASVEGAARSTNSFVEAARAAATLMAGGALVRGIGSAIDAYAHYTEAINAATVAFEEHGRVLTEFAHTREQAIGITRQQALELSANVGLLLQNMGFTQRGSAIQATELLQRAVDIASLRDVPGGPAQVLAAIESGISGSSTRPLRRVGIDVTQGSLLQRAREMGLDVTLADIQGDRELRAQLAIAQIFRQSEVAVGDFERTLRFSIPNQLRELERLREGVFLALADPLVAESAEDRTRVINDILMVAIEDLLPALEELAEAAGPALAEGLSLSVPMIESLSVVVRALAEALDLIPPQVLAGLGLAFGARSVLGATGTLVRSGRVLGGGVGIGLLPYLVPFGLFGGGPGLAAAAAGLAVAGGGAPSVGAAGGVGAAAGPSAAFPFGPAVAGLPAGGTLPLGGFGTSLDMALVAMGGDPRLRPGFDPSFTNQQALLTRQLGLANAAISGAELNALRAQQAAAAAAAVTVPTIGQRLRSLPAALRAEFASRRPTAIGLALPALLGFGQGASAGTPSFGDMLTAAGTGALVGAGGGLPGILAGAGIGLGSMFLGSIFGSRREREQFREQIESIAEAQFAMEGATRRATSAILDQISEMDGGADLLERFADRGISRPELARAINDPEEGRRLLEQLRSGEAALDPRLAQPSDLAVAMARGRSRDLADLLEETLDAREEQLERERLASFGDTFARLVSEGAGPTGLRRAFDEARGEGLSTVDLLEELLQVAQVQGDDELVDRISLAIEGIEAGLPGVTRAAISGDLIEGILEDFPRLRKELEDSEWAAQQLRLALARMSPEETMFALMVQEAGKAQAAIAEVTESVDVLFGRFHEDSEQRKMVEEFFDAISPEVLKEALEGAETPVERQRILGAQLEGVVGAIEPLMQERLAREVELGAGFGDWPTRRQQLLADLISLRDEADNWLGTMREEANLTEGEIAVLQSRIENLPTDHELQIVIDAEVRPTTWNWSLLAEQIQIPSELIVEMHPAFAGAPPGPPVSVPARATTTGASGGGEWFNQPLAFGRAFGGIIDSPQWAFFEGAPEVIIPLTMPGRAAQLARESGLVDILASQGINVQSTSTTNNNRPVNIYGPVVVQAERVDEFADSVLALG